MLCRSSELVELVLAKTKSQNNLNNKRNKVFVKQMRYVRLYLDSSAIHLLVDRACVPLQSYQLVRHVVPASTRQGSASRPTA